MKHNWCPDETLHAMTDFVVSNKGPLATLIGGRIRSLNAAIRQMSCALARLREARFNIGVRGPKRELAAQRNVEEAMQRLIPGATLVGRAASARP